MARAASDNRVRRSLQSPRIEYSHRLHYVQIVSEKLAKGWLADEADPHPPVSSHAGLVRLRQTPKRRPDVRWNLGMSGASVFRAYIDPLLELADQIESLSPPAAGFDRPNPEYPWSDPVKGLVIVPAEFAFPAFDPRDPRSVKLDRLINDLFSLAR